MQQEAQARARLSRQDWVEAARTMLVKAGIGAVSVDRLATSLGVTRGSFYHHFADRADLLQVLLEDWSRRWTYEIDAQIADLGLDPSNTILAWMRTILNRQAADDDAPFRAWALHDPMARAVVKQVDEARLGFITRQFEALGFTGIDAENRSRLWLHYELAAPAMFAGPSAEREAALLLERHRFLTTPSTEPSMQSPTEESP